MSGRRGRCTDIPCSGCYGGKQCRCTPNFPAPCDGRYGSEAPFAPRVGAKGEDDGYLVSFITDMVENRSECVVIDAKDIAAGPVCRILLPHRISSGTHACWAGREMLGG